MDIGAVERSEDAELEVALDAIHAELCAAQRRLLGVIVEHDRRGLWRRSGSTSEAAHLVATLAVSWRTASDWVRLGHALDRHPRLGEAFGDGAVSAEKLLSLVELSEARQPGSTTPAGPFDEPAAPPPPDAGSGAPGGPGDPGSGDGQGLAPEPGGGAPAGESGPTDEALMDLAGQCSAAQLARLARRARRRARAEADAAHHRRHLRAHLDTPRGCLALEGVLDGDGAATFWSAATAYLATCTPDPDTGRYAPTDQRLADAVVAMAAAYLGSAGGRGPRPTVVVHADARVLAGDDGWAETTGWSPVAADTVRRLACFCKLTVVAEGPDGAPVGVGRQQRIAPDWLADLVRHRDGGCRFPACGRRRFTQIHHVVEWDAGAGRTDLPNLIEICLEHHHLLHEGRWRAAGDPEGELRFTSPTGVVLRSWAARPDPDPAPAGAPPPTPPTGSQAPPPSGASGRVTQPSLLGVG